MKETEQKILTNKERMLAGQLYDPSQGGLEEEREEARILAHQFNLCFPADYEKRAQILKKLFSDDSAEEPYMEPPIFFDYGRNTTVGKNFYANTDCTILDVAPVKIGDNCMFAPHVSLYTASHPIHHERRNLGYEFGKPITLGDNVWLGGNVVVGPGVTIGDNAVIGAGSVVVKDIPANCVAAGNPAKVIKTITDEDKNYFYKKELFELP